jgi:hypothetical protein
MLPLIFLVVFPFALWKAWKNIQMAKASTGWPTVSGTVTTSERAKVMFRKQPRVTYSYSQRRPLWKPDPTVKSRRNCAFC